MFHNLNITNRNTYLSPLRRGAGGRGLLILIFSLLLTTTLYADNTVGGDDMPWDNDDPVLTGDINGDGKVNILDLTALIKLLHEQQQTGKPTSTPAADVNSDSKVTLDDVTALREIILRPAAGND